VSVAGDVLRRIESLRFGDLIFLRWGDASLDISKLPGDHEVEAPVYAWGVFLASEVENVNICCLVRVSLL